MVLGLFVYLCSMNVVFDFLDFLRYARVYISPLEPGVPNAKLPLWTVLPILHYEGPARVSPALTFAVQVWIGKAPQPNKFTLHKDKNLSVINEEPLRVRHLQRLHSKRT